MSEEKSSSRIPSCDELKTFNKHELQSFLKARAVGQTGNKDTLLNLAQLYANRPVINSGPEVTVAVDLPNDYVTTWQNVDTEKVSIPTGFTLEKIVTFLSVISSSLSFGESDEDETVDVGTQKPVMKGRMMYQSQRLQMAQFGYNSRFPFHLVFRANCSASLKKNELRYPRVVISQEGNVIQSSCVCPARADGRCCHVAALLYLMEDLTYKNIPKLSLPSTSVPQYWGRGKKRCNDPKPAHVNQYSKKRKVDRFIDFDPRNAGKSPNTEVLLRGVQSMHRDSMFGNILRFKYESQELSQDRKMVLHELRKKYESSMEVHSGIDPILSNHFGAHMSGTVGQGDCELWLQLRRGRITASCFKDIATNPHKFATNLWKRKPDLQNVKSIMWGTDNESRAREAYEKIHFKKVQQVGLFVSKILPLVGASPDGLIDEGRGLLEIKCPYGLRTSDLKSVSDGSFFTVTNDKLHLRKTHQYYYQVQCQMLCTGARYTDFFIWTPKGHHTERIPFDPNFTRTEIYKAIKGFRAFVIPEYFEQRGPRNLPVIECE